MYFVINGLIYKKEKYISYVLNFKIPIHTILHKLPKTCLVHFVIHLYYSIEKKNFIT